MKKIVGLLIISIIATGCGSAKIKKDFGEEYGWLCTSKENAKKFVKYSVPGQEEDTCIKLHNDKDTTRDFFVRDWEKELLPPMPDLP